MIVTSGSASSFSTSTSRASDKADEEGGHGHHEESFEEFTARSVRPQLLPTPTPECI
jgi:hypothetical protein